MDSKIVGITPDGLMFLAGLIEFVVIVWALIVFWKMYKKISLIAEVQKNQYELMQHWYAAEGKAWELEHGERH